MKTLSIALKTITVGLTLTSSISFAADLASPAEKYVNKGQLMQILREGGLSEGTQNGLTLDGKKCELTISTASGKEKVAMQSEADEYAQELLFSDDLSEIPFRIRESSNGISITQDFFDSYQDVKIEKISSTEVKMTFTEYIAGDKRILTCSFK